MGAAIDLVDTFARARRTHAGSRWLGIYGVQGSADNLTRVTVDGEANNTNFLQVTVNRSGAGHALRWERVPYDSHP